MRNSLLLLFFPAALFAEQNCIYTTNDGMIASVTSVDAVPLEYRSSAKCVDVKKRSPARVSTQEQRRKSIAQMRAETKKRYDAKRPLRPDQLNLNRTKRQREIQTSLGRVLLSWEASAEKYLRKSPEKTVTNTMRAAARTLAQNSFPPDLRNLKYDWRIVIMDKVPPEADIKVNGQGACHPGWMRFPADIFIAAERIATSCGRKRLSLQEGSEALEETLIHEIGHAIEFKMLGNRYRSHQRWHNEGFATWFESLGANYISGRGVNKSRMRERVRKSWNSSWDPRQFKGSGEDYARGYAMIATIAEKTSIRRLQQVYIKAANSNRPMLTTISEELRWSLKDLYKKVERNYGLK